MSQISTILWDVGGVLLTNGWDHVERDAVLAYFSLDRAEFEARHPEPNDQWERGLIDAEQYLEQTVFHEPRAFTPEDFLAQMKLQSKLLPTTGLPVLQEIAASGTLELAILNNESRELNDHRIETFELYSYFDCFLSSCYVGLRKPEPRIYQLALDVLQRDAEEVVFIDDRERNIEAARALGINGIVFENAAQLSIELSTLGIAAVA